MLIADKTGSKENFQVPNSLVKFSKTEVDDKLGLGLFKRVRRIQAAHFESHIHLTWLTLLKRNLLSVSVLLRTRRTFLAPSVSLYLSVNWIFQELRWNRLHLTVQTGSHLPIKRRQGICECKLNGDEDAID